MVLDSSTWSLLGLKFIFGNRVKLELGGFHRGFGTKMGTNLWL
jgi:hypothetical protein